ncbi:hypothetical protein KP509_04G077500 [Ceratopteris richardii]|uniref:J domain-containing protein n=1 Tax=Ceratopteris richardii TaxID=49495 RepID=A0A8T2V1I7_CERRI|nr:hypothetical protein KP509_04G077500 [Ceratopteris richardii]
MSLSNPSSSSSRSANLRERGNVLYRQALQPGLCVPVQRSRLLKALESYEAALAASLTAEDRASCHKNIGMLQWALCKSEMNHLLQHALNRGEGKVHVRREDVSRCKVLIVNAVDAISKALKHGAEPKPAAWLDGLKHVLKQMIEWASEQTSVLSLSHSPLLQYVTCAFEDAVDIPAKLKLLAYTTYVDALFKEALCKRLTDGTADHLACLSLLHDCEMHLARASSYFIVDPDEERKSLQKQIQDLECSVKVHICISEAMKSIGLGDICLSSALLDEEDIDMEKVKDALDYYRYASLATRDLDMEAEAIAMSRIGKVYSRVLALPEKAHQYFYQAVRLALTVMSPSIARSDWYKYSLEEVKAHQEAVANNERNKHERDRASAMKRLQETVAALKEAEKRGAEALLKHVYEQHPHPVLQRNVVPRLSTPEEVKASLKSAILHYHPDRNGQQGEDWKVLCEEITKCLNCRYAVFMCPGS